MAPIEPFKIKVFTFVILCAVFLSYTFWLYSEVPAKSKPANTLAEKGKMIWQQKNCSACHQLYGLGGHLGPDLTNVYSRRPEIYIRAILQAGTPVMPDFHLSSKEKDALVAFFKYTNTTGTADPKSFTQHLDGTISQP
ncbi:MAG: cytochrome c [Chitinophagaceae bacterium]|nr:cytochrome c [Chitinophagaceae bacterium]